MINPLYEKLAAHIGHEIEVAQYADGENVAVECMDCCEILVDADREEEDPVVCKACGSDIGPVVFPGTADACCPVCGEDWPSEDEEEEDL